MKILFWTDGFAPRIGGVETQGFQFVCGMKKRGHLCTVLAQKDHAKISAEENYQGIQIQRFDFNEIIKNKDIKKIVPINAYFQWIVEKFQPDVIYLNTLANGSAFLFLLFRKIFQMPVIVTVHAPYYWDGIPPLVGQICSSVDWICCASNWGRSVMEQVLPHQRDKMKTIYYGLSLPKTEPTPLPFDPPTVLLLGRFSSEKGFEIGIEAFSLLKKSGSNAKLLIAGEGDERPFLEHLVDRFHLRAATQFTGKIPRHSEEVYSVINRASCVVMPSNFEAFGLVALEAMRMKRPVIASNVGGLPELVVDGERGLLVPPKNPTAFFHAMKKLLDDPKGAIEMGERAKSWATHTFLLEENLNQYEHLFEDCICLRSV